MYTTRNFKTKKALKQAVANNEDVTIFQPGLGKTPKSGTVCLEGPHYPERHTWCATATVKNGIVVEVRR